MKLIYKDIGYGTYQEYLESDHWNKIKQNFWNSNYKKIKHLYIKLVKDCVEDTEN